MLKNNLDLMLLTGSDIIEIIPQRHPVVMLTSLISCDEMGARTSLSIDEGNIFSSEGVFTESGIIENIAQTAAAQIGYLCKIKNVSVPIGFIGAVKNLEVFSYPKVGSEITTVIQIENEVFGVTLITGKVFHNELLIASAEMKIVIKN